jgi:hypothetical protein
MRAKPIRPQAPPLANSAQGCDLHRVIESLAAADFGLTIARSAGATLVLFARADHPDTKALSLMLEAAGVARDWHLYTVDPREDPHWVRGLGLNSLPALWLYIDGDYHANVFALVGPGELSRPASIAAAVAKARLGPPLPPPGA